ncbi:TPA: hypothetical protein ACTXXA_001458, partial [Legionella anisa]
EKNSNDTESTIEDEWISGILHSGTCSDGKNLENDATYSMFGTNREIKSFGLLIRKNENPNDEAKCVMGGFVGTTIEGDGFIEDQTFDDEVWFNLFLTPQQFNKIVDLIKSKRMDILEITLWGPPGFYYEYSPAPHSSVYYIKILTDSKDHKVVIPDGCKICPPRLGDADFNIKIIQRLTLNPKQDLSNINIEKLFYESEDDDNNNQRKEIQEYKQIVENILNQLNRMEGIFAYPLWMIFIILCLLFTKFIILN